MAGVGLEALGERTFEAGAGLEALGESTFEAGVGLEVMGEKTFPAAVRGLPDMEGRPLCPEGLAVLQV